MRPFADQIYSGVLGANRCLHPNKVHSTAIPGNLSAKLIDLMLHGSDTDTSRFWGETQGDMLEAMTINNVPDLCGAIIFAGRCWGALTVRTRAAAYRAGDPIQVVTRPSPSRSLSWRRGPMLSVGCTGAHYSPMDGDLNFFGAPMHSAFWKHVNAGKRPAEALFQAKIDYIKGMPHPGDIMAGKSDLFSGPLEDWEPLDSPSQTEWLRNGVARKYAADSGGSGSPFRRLTRLIVAMQHYGRRR
ncbi:hypothetical protein [Bradyrhizobium ottawaense]|uniref:hypothetical protein n=1 Tax=Bradyrhizobium ottawaense TaxID=931866 RepID=UPI003F9F00C6